jgi:PTH1 family peptidyl-tRNA hydrolase
MRFIIGLGNLGAKYQDTRHNTGFLIIDALADNLNLTWQTNKKFNAEVASGKNLILVKPQTFMNNSGQAVRAILDYYKMLPKTLGILTARNADLAEKLTVIHDDLDLLLGKYKIQAGHSSAGHRGVQSVIDLLKTQNFTRVRAGVANELLRVKIPAEKFVLEKFSREEKEKLKKIVPEIIKNII